MGDIKIKKLLRDALRPEDRPPLTDDEVEEFLSSVDEEPAPSSIERSEGQFAEKVFEREHEKPIRHVEGSPTFGEWIKGLRSAAAVTRRAVAAAIGKDLSFINQLESGAVLPWRLPAIDVARLIKLYRIHSEAVWNLVTELTAEEQPVITSYVNEPSRPGLSTDRKRLPQDVLKWLKDLNESLSQLGAADLLK